MKKIFENIFYKVEVNNTFICYHLKHKGGDGCENDKRG